MKIKSIIENTLFYSWALHEGFNSINEISVVSIYNIKHPITSVALVYKIIKKNSVLVQIKKIIIRVIDNQRRKNSIII